MAIENEPTLNLSKKNTDCRSRVELALYSGTRLKSSTDRCHRSRTNSTSTWDAAKLTGNPNWRSSTASGQKCATVDYDHRFFWLRQGMGLCLQSQEANMTGKSLPALMDNILWRSWAVGRRQWYSFPNECFIKRQNSFVLSFTTLTEMQKVSSSSFSSGTVCKVQQTGHQAHQRAYGGVRKHINLVIKTVMSDDTFHYTVEHLSWNAKTPPKVRFILHATYDNSFATIV